MVWNSHGRLEPDVDLDLDAGNHRQHVLDLAAPFPFVVALANCIGVIGDITGTFRRRAADDVTRVQVDDGHGISFQPRVAGRDNITDRLRRATGQLHVANRFDGSKCGPFAGLLKAVGCRFIDANLGFLDPRHHGNRAGEVLFVCILQSQLAQLARTPPVFIGQHGVHIRVQRLGFKDPFQGRQVTRLLTTRYAHSVSDDLGLLQAGIGKCLLHGRQLLVAEFTATKQVLALVLSLRQHQPTAQQQQPSQQGDAQAGAGSKLAKLATQAGIAVSERLNHERFLVTGGVTGRGV